VSVQNRLAEIRQSRGYAAADLAARISLSRQTIYAIEAGSYVPNTAVALRLAQVLDVRVEDLFHMDDAPPAAPETREVDLVADDPATSEGQPVRLARVGLRTVAAAPSPVMWCLPPADGFLLENAANRRARVRLLGQREPIENRLVIAGCDPGVSVLERHMERSGTDLVLVHANSSRALALLKAGMVHAAGSHLRDGATGESNVSSVKKLFPRGGCAIVSVALWEEGLVVARGNPKRIRGVEDLARRGIRLVNRERGSGSRLLLDARLRDAGIHPAHIHGYASVAPGHLPAAWQVRSGNADCCVATRASARVLGLDFIPWISERYDLVLRKHSLALAPVQALLDTLNRAAFRRELQELGDYDTSVAGALVA